MDSEVFSRIRDYLADQLEVEPEKITPDSDIVNDFGADSRRDLHCTVEAQRRSSPLQAGQHR